MLLAGGQIRKMVSSYVGENKLFDAALSVGRAGAGIQSAGHPGRAHPRRRRGHSGLLHQDRRRHAGGRGQGGARVRRRDLCDGAGLKADLSIVKAWKGDAEGNLIYRKTARNFNPMMATAGKVTRGRGGGAGPDRRRSTRTRSTRPASIVDRIFQGAAFEKRIEQRDHPARATRRRRRRGSLMAWTRDDMAARAAQGAAGRLLRQPRHRHPDPGGQLHSRRACTSPCRARTACWAWARSPTRARRTPT